MTMLQEKIKQEINIELQIAEDSRSGGNEGRARVCARRAAGLAIGYFYEFQTGDSAPKNAYNLLQWISARGEISSVVRDAAQRLTVRVTPDHTLPHDEDPIADAGLIIDALIVDDLYEITPPPSAS
jgi:hypothetical protein